MRESPWHARRPVNEHARWYANLAERHHLTVSWAAALSAVRPTTYRLKRSYTPKIEQAPWLLDGLVAEGNDGSGPKAFPALESILEARLPAEFLRELESAIWTLQAWTYGTILEKTPAAERAAVKNLLEQASWRAGRETARARWGKAPEGLGDDLRAVVAALRDSPLSPIPGRPVFLVCRALADEVSAELLDCPHRVENPELELHADEICAHQSHWARGFSYELNSRTRVDYVAGSGADSRCSFRWFLHAPGGSV